MGVPLSDAMDWDDISEPGCYLMVASGLLARIHPEDLDLRRSGASQEPRVRVVMLSGNPRLTLSSLRAIAARAHHPVSF